MLDFKDFMFQERMKRNMSLREFADLVGVSHGLLSLIENGSREDEDGNTPMTFDTLKKIADVLDVDISVLIATFPIKIRGMPTTALEVITEQRSEVDKILIALEFLNEDGLEKAKEYIDDLRTIPRYTK